MTNLSESAVFVQSRSMNENYQADPFTIIKLCQHNEAIIFNNLVSAESYVNVRADYVLFFRSLHNDSNILSTKDLTRSTRWLIYALVSDTIYSKSKKQTILLSVRISFVKGWGENYARKYVTDTLCWVELTINTPMDWVDKVSRNMRESHYKVPSYRSSHKLSIYNGSFTLKECYALLDKL